MKGRKPIPSKIVALMGGSQHTHRPERTEEPKPPEKMPPCPRHLDKIAKKEWRRASKILAPIGLLTEADMMIFAAYCDAYSRWVTATEEVQSKGMVRSKQDGTPILNPFLRIASVAYDQMIKAGVQIGLSPSSRACLKVEKPKPKGKVESFMARKNGTNG